MKNLNIALFIVLLLCSLLNGTNALAQSVPLFKQSAVRHQVEVSGSNNFRSDTLNLNTPIDLTKPVIFNFSPEATFECSLTKQLGADYGSYETWTGRIKDTRFEHLPHFINVILIYNRITQRITASIETKLGYFLLLPTPQHETYVVHQLLTNDIPCQTFVGSKIGHRDLQSLCNTPCSDELDSAGNYVVDVFMGYSLSAESEVTDIDAYSLLQIGSVNSGLYNSMVDSVRLRLVGTGTTTHNPGVVPSVLDDCYDWFAHQIDSLAADFVVVYQSPTGAPDEAGGLACVGGYYSECNIHMPTAYRHEMGHNVGGAHCPGDGGSISTKAHGYNNGHWTTHMCGNEVNFYSTPLVNDDLGNPIGTSDSADMAQVWRDRKAEISRVRLHSVRFYVGDTCYGQMCPPQHWGSEADLIQRVQFNTIDNNESSPGWNCPSITGYSSYIDQITTIQKLHSYTLTVTPNYSWDDSKLSAWIDWNQNNHFDSTEHVLSFSGIGPWTGVVTVPASASLGQARLRIRLQYQSDTSYVQNPCIGSAYSGGETEDYAVNVVTTTEVPANIAQAAFTVFPNPSQGYVRITTDRQCEVLFYNCMGQLLKRVWVDKNAVVSLSDLPKGVYLVRTSDFSGSRKIVLE